MGPQPEAKPLKVTGTTRSEVSPTFQVASKFPRLAAMVLSVTSDLFLKQE